MRPSGRLAAFRSRWTLVSVATLAFWLAVQALKPFVALHLADLGATEVEVGLAVAAHPLLSLFLAIPAGRYMDQRGLRRYMLGSLMMAAVVGLGYAVADTIGQIAFLQLITGLAELGAWIGIQAIITQAGDVEFRQRHVAIFSVAWGLGIAVGPTLGAWVFEVVGFAAVGVTYAVLVAIAAVAVAFVPYRDRPDAAARPGSAASSPMMHELGVLARRPGVLAVLAGSFVALWANSLRTSFYPLFLDGAGLSVPRIGFLMSLAGFTTLVGRLPLLWLVRLFGASAVLVGGTVAMVVSLTVTPLLASSHVALGVASGLFGIGFGLVTPLTIDLMAEHSEEARRGMAMGMRVAANRAAQVLQPLTFGATAAVVGMAGGFVGAGVVMGASTVLMARWLRTDSTPGVHVGAAVEPSANRGDGR